MPRVRQDKTSLPHHSLACDANELNPWVSTTWPAACGLPFLCLFLCYLNFLRFSLCLSHKSEPGVWTRRSTRRLKTKNKYRTGRHMNIKEKHLNSVIRFSMLFQHNPAGPVAWKLLFMDIFKSPHPRTSCTCPHIFPANTDERLRKHLAGGAGYSLYSDDRDDRRIF